MSGFFGSDRSILFCDHLLPDLPAKVSDTSDRENEQKISEFFADFHFHRKDIRPGVCHEVCVWHYVDRILEITPCNVRQCLIPASESQDMEPLDEEADEREDSVHPHDKPDEDPVHETEKKFNAAGIVFKKKELLRGRRFF